MKKPDFKKAWGTFLQWKGWKMTASFWITLWRRIVSWTGWKVLFGLPFGWILALSLVCTAGLVWVFTQGLETQLPGYLLYPVCFCCLVALCLRLPGAFRRGKAWVSRHPKAAAYFQSSDQRFTRKLYRGQIINFAYGSFKIGAGIFYGSAWIGSDGIYNLAQAMIQLFQILRRKNPGSLGQQWKSYRICGVLILLMHLTLIGNHDHYHRGIRFL